MQAIYQKSSSQICLKFQWPKVGHMAILATRGAGKVSNLCEDQEKR